MPLLVLPIVTLGAVALLWAGRRIGAAAPWRGSAWAAKNVRYQPIALGVAVLAVLLTRVVAPTHADFLAVGDWAAPASGLNWLGVADGDSWTSVGTIFLIIMTVVTGFVLWLQVGRGSGITPRILVSALPLAVAFSIVNALGEELLFRLPIAEALSPVWSLWAVAAASAVIFGVPHYFGNPGRLPGVVMAAFMGWLLTWAVVQTDGLGWAFVIHLAQDVVIITLLIARDRSSR